jgi:hypothetical protein
MEPTGCSEKSAQKFGRWEIAQKKEYNIQNTAKVLNQEHSYQYHFSPTVSPSAVGCCRVVTCMETPGGKSWNV